MLILIYLLLYFKIFPQDIHFSQFFNSPLNLNPAESSTMNSDYRFHINYRTQWYSITIPYVSYSFSYESKFKIISVPGYIYYGLLFNNDYAGDGKFGTLQGAFNISYSVISKDSSLIFSIGILPLFNQNNIDFSKFYFDNQYNGIYFDPNILHNETFPEKKFYFIDFNSGLYVSKMINKTYLNFGFSLFHIFKPQKSFYNSYIVTLDQKFNLHTNINLSISKNTILTPMILWSNQYKLKEIYLGGLFTIKSSSLNFNKYYFGIATRIGDAIILYGGLNYNNTQIILSYDVNISPLIQASNMKGGFEVGIRYVLFKTQKVFLLDKHICPTIL